MHHQHATKCCSESITSKKRKKNEIGRRLELIPRLTQSYPSNVARTEGQSAPRDDKDLILTKDISLQQHRRQEEEEELLGYRAIWPAGWPSNVTALGEARNMLKGHQLRVGRAINRAAAKGQHAIISSYLARPAAGRPSIYNSLTFSSSAAGCQFPAPCRRRSSCRAISFYERPRLIHIPQAASAAGPARLQSLSGLRSPAVRSGLC